MNGKFQFVLKEREGFFKSSCMILEFAESENYSDFYLHTLREHGVLIAKQERLVSMAEGLRAISSCEN